jgi:hypothetical protein
MRWGGRIGVLPAIALVAFGGVFSVVFGFLVFALSRAVYIDTAELLFGCGEHHQEVKTDDDAVEVVRNWPSVLSLMRNYPEVEHSSVYVLGMQGPYEDQYGQGGWSVSRGQQFPFREVIKVEFSYRFIKEARVGDSLIGITCTMGKCSPTPDCVLGGP